MTSFKKFFVVFIVLITSTAFDLPYGQISSPPPADPPIDKCSIQNSAFQDGEELVYKIYYNWNFVWLSAGEVKFKVTDLGNQYHIAANGRTYDSYDLFFKVRDSYQTFVDKETMMPKVSVRQVEEGKYRLYDKLTFNQGTKKVASLRGKNKTVATEATYDVDNCMHDILSAIYFMRNIPYNTMATGTHIPFDIFMDKEVWPLKLRYRGKESNKKIKGLGRFNTIKFSPEVIEGYVFTKESELVVWATDDNNRLPLLIETPISIGSVKCVLKSYSGLKHDFSSKLD
jgi:hypothetical protein